jgi:hypothetical protein
MKRIQRKRTKGWRTPAGVVYVGRGSKWGNPFKLVGDMIYVNCRYRRWNLDPWVYYSLGDISDVIYLYGKLFDGTQFWNRDIQHWADHFKNMDINELKGKDLSCWCALDKPCHADILLKLSNNISE